MFKEKHYIPKNNEVILNRKLFIEFNDHLVRTMEDLFNEEDTDVWTLNELKAVLRKHEIDDTYIEHSLTFLEKVKKVQKFGVKIEGNDFICVKLLKDAKSTVTNKDTAIVTLNLSIKKIDKVISELESKIQETLNKVKEHILKKDKQVKYLS